MRCGQEKADAFHAAMVRGQDKGLRVEACGVGGGNEKLDAFGVAIVGGDSKSQRVDGFGVELMK